jgi:alanine racemase
MSPSLSWVEISRDNLVHNIGTFKRIIGQDRVLCAAVKANAYGHGLTECAPIMVEAGADWLGVNSLAEAESLRAAGVSAPVYIMGYVPFNELERAILQGFRLVAYNKETLLKMVELTRKEGQPVFVHLKIETGNFRQGVLQENLDEILSIFGQNPSLRLEGAATHFSNIEDTSDSSYAEMQLKNFKETVDRIEAGGFKLAYKHCANTAATILYPHTYFNMVRTGIGNYGLWPSNETMVTANHLGKKVELKPVLSWKTKIAQIKKVPADSLIGYGCTYKADKDLKLAILPVGYYEGYSRNLSNKAYALIRGKKAPVRGRVCMNITMVDVTEIPEARLEDEVVLLGRQGTENISAEKMAQWQDTINYEVTTKINERLRRVVV